MHRDETLEANFLKWLKNSVFPPCDRDKEVEQISTELLVDIFQSQIYSRHIDLLARRWRREGKSFYTISSTGHEGNAVIAALSRTTDPALLHYRSGAFQVQRIKGLNTHFLRDMLYSIQASANDPVSGGRHKVIGSKHGWIIPQTSTIGSHLPRAVGLARSIPLTKKLRISTDIPSDSIVICSFGDASFNHSTAQGALNLANWLSFQAIPLPILFVCEDNGLGISVPTPKNWINVAASSYSSIKYFHGSGLCLLDTLKIAREAISWVRNRHRPAILHIKTVRLLAHAGSDIESTYRTALEIEKDESQDPLLHSASILISNGIMDLEEVINLYSQIGDEVQQEGEKLQDLNPLKSAKEIMSSLLPAATMPSKKLIFQPQNDDQKKYTMAKLLNLALHETMASLPNSIIFGEDVGAKGGVYNVTTGLQRSFGSRRVFDSILDEQSILGFGLGLSLNGFIPIPEIQFLAYVHNAEDQIRGEASTLSFFSNQQFKNPMVIRIPGFAYQKGFGGHFHNDNSIAVFRDIPGLIVVTPANGEDAVNLWRTAIRLAVENHRLVVFVEPIALYHTKDLFYEGDNQYLFQFPSLDKEIALFDVQTYGQGEDLAIISYANGIYLSLQAQQELAKLHIDAKVIDLRWLVPLPIDQILSALGTCRKICIVDECRKTGSLSEELAIRLLEESHFELEINRVTSLDSFIPLGDASSLVLVSKDDIIRSCKNLMR